MGNNTGRTWLHHSRESSTTLRGRLPMLVVLILAVMAVVVACVVLLQRQQTRKSAHKTYFSHTFGVSDPVPSKVEDETPNP